MNDAFAMSEQERVAYLQALGIDVWVDNTAADINDEKGSSLPEAELPPATLMQTAVSQSTEPAIATDTPLQRQSLPEELGQLAKHVAGCQLCSLHKTRTQTVFGVGHQKADWLIIGEAPGADEDQQGQPFVGRAGQLLTQMLRAIGLAREEVFIANILKCRPPNNRDPKVEEITACHDYLVQQIKLIEPKIILVVGRIAAQSMLGNKLAIGKLRGQLHHYGEHQIPLVVTYHPAYLLRSPGEKRKVWEDLKFARRQILDLEN